MKIFLLVVLVGGCDDGAPADGSAGPGDTADVDTGSDDTAGDPAGMYVAPDPSNCDYDMAYDVNADGSEDYTQHGEYDFQGLIVDYSYAYPEMGESVDYEQEYDERGCLLFRAYESVDADGSFSYTMDCSCDAFGQPEECEYVVLGSSGYTLWYFYESVYEGEENLLMAQTIELEYQGELYDRFESTFAYDEASRLTSVYRDNQDGPQWMYEQEWQADDRIKSRHYEYYDEEDGYTSELQSTFDEHDRYAITTYSEDPEAGADYRYSRTWYDEIYQTATLQVDEGNDGTDDIGYSYDCTLEWPWSCDVSQDGSSDEDDPREYDGTVDHRFQFVWGCD